MGKSFNRNQDKYGKWERERQSRDAKKHRGKYQGGTNNSGKKNLTHGTEWGSVDGSNTEN